MYQIEISSAAIEISALLQMNVLSYSRHSSNSPHLCYFIRQTVLLNSWNNDIPLSAHLHFSELRVDLPSTKNRMLPGEESYTAVITAATLCSSWPWIIYKLHVIFTRRLFFLGCRGLSHLPDITLPSICYSLAEGGKKRATASVFPLRRV